MFLFCKSDLKTAYVLNYGKTILPIKYREDNFTNHNI